MDACHEGKYVEFNHVTTDQQLVRRRVSVHQTQRGLSNYDRLAKTTLRTN